jgi:hypothetical protein
MEPHYIVEICIAIDIAILGIAYPIIIDKISNIGEKYSSEYIDVLFNKEFPQRDVRLPFFGFVPIIKLFLCATIFSFVFLIFEFRPLFGWNNTFINNSAKYVVFTLTFALTTVFLIWLNRVTLYSGHARSLLKFLISKYKKLPDDTERKTYHLKAINELTLYVVEKQDYHLQKTLLEFYSHLFYSKRQRHDKAIPLVYPVDLYFLVNSLSARLSKNKGNNLAAIEHRIASGVWLLGESSQEIQISEETYSSLWNGIYLNIDNERYIRMFWAHASQYFDYNLQSINERYQGNFIANIELVKKRDAERIRFLEFTYALGGLMLYSQKYSTLKYFFEYSQSVPQRYPLLPLSMADIFMWFEHFSNEFKHRVMPVEHQYPFPELDNYGNSGQISHSICKYMALLFVRQFTMRNNYIYENAYGQPHLPESVIELGNWKNNIPYFKNCLNQILADAQLISSLNYGATVANPNKFEEFMVSLEIRIVEAIGERKLKAQLSPKNVDAFLESSGKIIRSAFHEYKEILNAEEGGPSEYNLPMTITGDTILFSKSAFTDDDIPNINYDTVFASLISNRKIRRLIPSAFSMNKSRRYVVSWQNVIASFDKIITGDIDKFLIIGFDVTYMVENALVNSRYESITKLVSSTDDNVRDVLFILRKSDRPHVEFGQVEEGKIKQLQLVEVNESPLIYASVVDINHPDNEMLRKQFSTDDYDELKVLLAIEFSCTLFFKTNSSIVQVDIASQFSERGILDTLDEITPLESSN